MSWADCLCRNIKVWVWEPYVSCCFVCWLGTLHLNFFTASSKHLLAKIQFIRKGDGKRNYSQHKFRIVQYMFGKISKVGKNPKKNIFNHYYAIIQILSLKLSQKFNWLDFLHFLSSIIFATSSTFAFFFVHLISFSLSSFDTLICWRFFLRYIIHFLRFSISMPSSLLLIVVKLLIRSAVHFNGWGLNPCWFVCNPWQVTILQKAYNNTFW